MTSPQYVLAVVCAPLYFFMRKRWVAGVIHSGIYLFALLTLLFGFGVIIWFFGVLHAVWDLRTRMEEERIQRQATVMADKMGSRMGGGN